MSVSTRGKRPPINKTTTRLICQRLIQGMSMSQACASHDVPSASAIYLRTADDEGYARIIRRAREAQQNALMDTIQDLAASMTNENWQPIQARINVLKWRASKLHPDYSDKVQHTGTVQVEVRSIGWDWEVLRSVLSMGEIGLLAKALHKLEDAALADKALPSIEVDDPPWMIDGEAEGDDDDAT
jgi:hypothetical protein